MFKHNLFSLLSNLSKEEVKDLRLFICSPFFNSSKRILNVFDIIMKFYPCFNQSRLTKEYIFNRLSKEKKYSDSTVRDILSKLNHLTERFIFIRGIESNDISSGNFLLNEYTKRGLKDSFLKTFKKTDKAAMKIKLDSNRLHDLYLLSVHKTNFDIKEVHIANRKNSLKQIKEMNEAFMTLTLYYISEAVSYFLNSQVFRLNFNVESPYLNFPSELNDFNIHLQKMNVDGKYKYSFLLDLYILLSNCFYKKENKKYYYDYKKALSACSDRISKNEISFHYSKLITYCILKIKESNNNQEFKQELFKNYALTILNEYYKNENNIYLPVSLYRNIILLGLELEKTQWVENFVNDYSKKVPPDEAENMKNYSLAFLYKSKENYDLALEYSSKVNLTYFIYRYDIKIIRIISFYELGYTEEVLYIINSFKEMLRTDQLLNKNRKKYYILFLNLLSRLIKNADNLKARENIAYIINNTNNIAQKTWLLKIINDINKSCISDVS